MTGSRLKLMNRGSLTSQEAVDLWNVTGMLYNALGGLQSDLLSDDRTWISTDVNKTSDIFSNLTTSEADLFLRWTATMFSRFPQIGSMTATGTSPADPLFFAVHSAWERMWHYMRLTNAGDDDDEAWNEFSGLEGDDSSATCNWSKHAHSLLPWYNLTSYTTSNPDGYYTNYELMELFHPANIELPFLFDTFDWGHCENWESEVVDEEGELLQMGRVRETMGYTDMPQENRNWRSFFDNMQGQWH